MIKSGRGTNPFEDDDDDAFVRTSYKTDTSGFRDTSGFDESSNDRYSSPAQRQEQMKQESIRRQLESTDRSLASIYQSESMGIATAEELMQQGEQLDNIERKADYINAEMKNTQKSINSIKSVWGSLGEWWTTKKKKPEPEKIEKVEEEPTPFSNRSQPLQHALDNSRNSNSQGVPGGGYNNMSSRDTTADSTKQKTLMEDYYEKSDANLDAMMDGLSRLKNLGAGLGTEINSQNDQLERLQPKIAQAGDSVESQNRQMRDFLGGKKKKKLSSLHIENLKPSNKYSYSDIPW